VTPYDRGVTDPDCLFCRIVAGEIPSTRVYETDEVYAFADISPQAPVHVLVVPKDHHRDAGSLGASDPALAGRLLEAAAAVAEQQGVADGGYRVVFNTGAGAGQTVFHVHAHVLGGRPLGWPPFPPDGS
jgi:histidine triad (HIT) family protein